MILRFDIHESTVIPSDLKETILRVGGRNVYDEPLFRVVLAQDRYIKAAGAWNVWPENSTLDERSGLGIGEIQKILKEGQDVLYAMQAMGAKHEELKKATAVIESEVNAFLDERISVSPLRVERGMIEIPLYTFEGFILEKWQPAHTYGSPAEWYGFRFEGEAALGEYPKFGDYELCAGPTPYMPSSSQIEEAVSRNFKEIDQRPVNAQQRMLLLLKQQEERDKKRARSIKNTIQAAAGDSPLSLINTVSLGAGRVIQELATKAGIKGHAGN